MLAKVNRLRAGSDFNLVTKTGLRLNSENLVFYATLTGASNPKIGFIVNRSVGGSVTRHLVSRKLRHNLAQHIKLLPNEMMLVVRVLKQKDNYRAEIQTLVDKMKVKLNPDINKADR